VTTYRETVRDRHAARDAEVKKQGVNIDDIRKESRGSGAVAAMLSRALCDSTPTAGHERQYSDDFAGQVFNGTNSEYSLSRRVLGQNILVWHIKQSTGTAVPLPRGSNPAPSGSSFYFDGYFTIRVGTAPAALDGLIAAYITGL